MAQRLTAADFDPEVLILFDAYVHGALDRRGFLDKAKKYRRRRHDGGDAARRAEPEVRRGPAGARRTTRGSRPTYVEFPSPQGNGKARGYLVRPAKAAGKAAGDPRRAREPRPEPAHRGHRAPPRRSTATWPSRPDALFPLGGYPGDEDKARALFPTLDQPKTREDFVAAAGWLRARPDAHRQDRRGRLLLRRRHRQHARDARARAGRRRAVLRRRRAARRRAEDQGARCCCSSPRPTSASTPPGRRTRRRSRRRRCPYEAHIYPGTQHGFNNDTTPRYDEKTAKLAWERTMAHFAKHVKG